MKKLAILLSLIMIFGLAACENVTITFSDDEKTQATTQTEQNLDNQAITQAGQISDNQVVETESTPQKSEIQIKSDKPVIPENTESKDKQTTSKPKNTQNSSKIDNPASAQKISVADAKNIALKHAGVTAADIFDFDIESDYEKGEYVWEINFEDKKYDYEYIIDIQTGKILHSEKEIDY